MSSPAPVLLILGAGSNIGQHVAKAFAAKGYKLALASRSANEADNTSDKVHYSVDLSDPAAVEGVFAKVHKQLGHPSVVVFNAAGANKNDPKNPLSLPAADLTKSLTLNTISSYVAAQQAVKGFEELPATASKTFIYTGNALNFTPIPFLLDLGVGKSATAHIIQVLAGAYADRGIKFYYADERKADGSAAFAAISGEAAADFYPQLAEGKSQGPWLQTFVKGSGYQKFPVNGGES